MSDLVDTALECDAVMVSSCTERPERGWVYLAVIDESRVLRVSLSPPEARRLSEFLAKHADRVGT